MQARYSLAVGLVLAMSAFSESSTGQPEPMACAKRIDNNNFSSIACDDDNDCWYFLMWVTSDECAQEEYITNINSCGTPTTVLSPVVEVFGGDCYTEEGNCLCVIGSGSSLQTNQNVTITKYFNPDICEEN